MTSLVVAEHNNKTLSDATHRTVTAAKALGAPVHVLVAGHDCASVAQAAAKLDGVDKVHHADDAAYGHFLAEPLADLLVTLADAHDALLAPATTTGKNVMPRVAALLDVMQVSDISAVVAPDTFERPVYAGNAIQTVKSTDAKKIITVRTTAFSPTGEGGSAAVETIAAVGDPALSRFVGEETAASDRPDLSAAKVVISGGRALGSAEKFKQLLEPLADTLNGAIGASRAAVDAGYAPNDLQVGQTGKVVAPDLYIAIGISGAIQHLAGMKGARVIVAINKDEDAPIFKIADYGLVADIFEAVPQLTQALNNANS
jgi:electron transfer flavoprotein alpha subunit